MKHDLMDGLKRWHLMTEVGRKTVWAPTLVQACRKVEPLVVLDSHEAPDPLKCEQCGKGK